MYYYNGAGQRYPYPEQRMEPGDCYPLRRRRPGKVCPDCGATLDYGEMCDCEEELEDEYE